MEFKIKSFDELSTLELHDLLQLRSEIFVVEQDCVYQDIDGKDLKALHVLGYQNETMIAYARCFGPGDYFDQASIGRILVKDAYRGDGQGDELLINSIQAVYSHYNTKEIKLSAQTYLKQFYQKHGFEVVGQPYLEDGIPHIGMLKRG